MKRILRDSRGHCSVAVTVPREAKKRMLRSAFRGSDRRAGVFYRFNSVDGFFDDHRVRRAISSCFRMAVDDLSFNRVHTLRFTIEASRMIGWASTIPVGLVNRAVCRDTWPSVHWHALRVMDESVPAPMTNRFTVVASFSRGSKGWDAKVRSVWPGEDFGVLRGDLTAERGLAIFDFDHPGEAFARGRKRGAYWPVRMEKYRRSLEVAASFSA